MCVLELLVISAAEEQLGELAEKKYSKLPGARREGSKGKKVGGLLCLVCPPVPFLEGG